MNKLWYELQWKTNPHDKWKTTGTQTQEERLKSPIENSARIIPYFYYRVIQVEEIVPEFGGVGRK